MIDFVKMDRTSILGDAIEYIEELQKTEKDLKAELAEIEDEKCYKKKDELVIPKLNAHNGSKTSTTIAGGKEKMEVRNGEKGLIAILIITVVCTKLCLLFA